MAVSRVFEIACLQPACEIVTAQFSELVKSLFLVEIRDKPIRFEFSDSFAHCRTSVLYIRSYNSRSGDDWPRGFIEQKFKDSIVRPCHPVNARATHPANNIPDPVLNNHYTVWYQNDTVHGEEQYCALELSSSGVMVSLTIAPTAYRGRMWMKETTAPFEAVACGCEVLNQMHNRKQTFDGTAQEHCDCPVRYEHSNRPIRSYSQTTRAGGAGA